MFNINDLSLAESLCSEVGYGSVQHYRSYSNAVEWVINSREGITDMVNLINGHMRWPKIHKLHSLIEWINANYGSNSIATLEIDSSPLSSNGWLAGFNDGDGSFQIRCTETRAYRRVETSYELTQSRINPNLFAAYRLMMVLISTFTLAKLGERVRKVIGSPDRHLYLVRNTSQLGANVLTNYFNLFPLLSSKYLDFLAWSEPQTIIKDKLRYG